VSVNHLPQQFIVDHLSEQGFAIPNTLLDPCLDEKLKMFGFEWPSSESYQSYVTAINTRYPCRNFIPFAKSCSNDDVVGLLNNDKSQAGSVICFHDFASPGFEDLRHFKSITDWLGQQEKEG